MNGTTFGGPQKGTKSSSTPIWSALRLRRIIHRLEKTRRFGPTLNRPAAIFHRFSKKKYKFDVDLAQLRRTLILDPSTSQKGCINIPWFWWSPWNRNISAGRFTFAVGRSGDIVRGVRVKGSAIRKMTWMYGPGVPRRVLQQSHHASAQTILYELPCWISVKSMACIDLELKVEGGDITSVEILQGQVSNEHQKLLCAGQSSGGMLQLV